MMMLAVMYGMIPRAKMAKLSKAPPENRFRNPIAPWLRAWSRSEWTAWSSMPGTRIAAPRR